MSRPKSNIFIWGNNIYILIDSDKSSTPLYKHGTIGGYLFETTLTIDDIPSEAVPCKSFLEVLEVYKTQP